MTRLSINGFKIAALSVLIVVGAATDPHACDHALDCWVLQD